ncbi:MAG: hypothetical protein IKH04_00090 [Kiritimatiellae bacterium]|nr:hypothetical protein [Kiritimatiellia bacterium]
MKTIRMHSCFGDHMVVQRDFPVRFSGTARPGAAVSGTFRGVSATATASASGDWELEFPAGGAGGPFEFSATCDGARTELHDILCGEVWLCSGQSNMEYPVIPSGPFWGLPEGHDVATRGDPSVRLLQIPRRMAPDGEIPETPASAKWKVADAPDAILEFSAVAWFFGLALRRELGVPVGLVHSSWGGTAIQPWISRDAFARSGRTVELETLEKALSDNPEDHKLDDNYLRQVAAVREWLRDKYFQTDPGTTAEAVARWAAPELPAGEEAKWRRGPRGCLAGLAVPGVCWFRREFVLPESWNGRELVLHADGVNDCDEMFVDGAKIGETFLETPGWWAAPRDYAFTPKAAPGGRHVLAVRVQNHFASGSFNGELFIQPSGDCDSAPVELSDGDWLERIEFRVDKKKAGVRPPVSSDAGMTRDSAQLPTTLFNGMVACLRPLTLRGAIWYQGCTNRGDPGSYAELQDILIDSWRHAFRNPGLVFIGTQLAAFREHHPELRLPEDWWRGLTPGESIDGQSFVYIREAQALLLDRPGCGVACTIDVGDHSDIHPRWKKPVGERLAHEALRLAYGRSDALPGPRAAKAERLPDGEVRVTLRDAGGGLEIRSAKTGEAASAIGPHLFALHGDDGQCAWADATLEPDGTIAVRSGKIANPVRVEYAWSDYPPDADIRRATDSLPLFPFSLEVTPKAR